MECQELSSLKELSVMCRKCGTCGSGFWCCEILFYPLMARVIAQIIPARIQEEIAVCWRSERSWDCRNFFELFDRAIALAGPRVNQRQVGNGELLFERDWVLRLLQEFLKARLAAQRIPERH